ncbi:MAG: GyrI-like domain-containing protein [Maribacter sp.]|nr:GyrI-like domain-containing protein [Maribacter sp.]MBT8302195.1 GyrI-like domain-containing protein [Maribacter sp.]
MQPRIVELTQKKLVGMNMSMSLLNDRTGELWSRFMPKVNDIGYKLSEDKISMQVYPTTYFERFNPKHQFVKWAMVEVGDFCEIPDDLNQFMLQEGLYAVFDYKGPSYDKSIFQYIYTKWLPISDYNLDNRPHFEVLGESYRNNNPESEEEIWIPIQLK